MLAELKKGKVLKGKFPILIRKLLFVSWTVLGIFQVGPFYPRHKTNTQENILGN